MDGKARTAQSRGGAATAIVGPLARFLRALQSGAFAGALERELEVERTHGHSFLWLGLVFVAGAGVWRMFAEDPPGLAIAGVLLAFIFGSRCATGGTRRFSMVAAAFAAGLCAAEFESLRRDVTIMDGPVVTTITGIVTAREIDDAGDWRYTVRLTSTDDPQIGRPPERVRLLARSDHRPVGIGEAITGLARIAPPSGPAVPGSFDFAYYAYYRGLGAYGFFYGAPERTTLMAGPNSLAVSLRREVRELRETIAFRLRDVIGGDAGAVAAAMTVSDRRAISGETIEAFRVTGLAHILSISGLHMSLAAAIMFTGLRLGFSFFPVLVQRIPVKKLAAAGALMSSSFYLVISGAVISAQRAWIMVAIMLVAVVLDRAALTLRNVAIAAILIALISPSAVSGPGFQMSFAATAALIAAYGAWARRSDGENPALSSSSTGGWVLWAWRFVAGLAATAVIAGAATGIFSAHHFHRMAGYGIVANVAAMPIISVLVMPFATLGLLAMPFGLERPFLLVMGWGLESVIRIAHAIAGRGADFATGQMPLSVTALLTTALAIAVLMRSRLRWAALLPGLAALAIMIADPPRRPDILIEEEGRLVAISSADRLASNRMRPSDFIFDQWLSATRRTSHLAPADLSEIVNAAGSATKGAPVIATAVSALRERGTERRFYCLDDAFCIASLGRNILVVTLEDPAYTGAACDVATLVVTPAKLDMRRCRSGALLLTASLLRQSGAAALYLQGERSGESSQSPIDPRTPDEPASHAALRIETAVSGAVRPWTLHRYYDWRERDFTEPYEELP